MTRAPSPTDDELPAEIIEAAMRYTRVCHQNANGCPNGQYIEDASRTALAAVILAALRASRAERDEARNDLDLCDQRYNEEYLAVDRVWKALGITTYEEAHGKEISEHVGDLRTRAEAAERERDALREALLMVSPWERRDGSPCWCDEDGICVASEACEKAHAALAPRPPCSAEATQGKPVKEE